MKDKSWIIILIMGIALTISLAYSIAVSQKSKNEGESTVTTTSIIEMKASTVTIKNTLTGIGNVEYTEKSKTQEQNEENNQNETNNSGETNLNNEEGENKIDSGNEESLEKSYQITLSIEDKNLEKAKKDQEVDITIKKDEETTLTYVGKVINVNKDINNKSTLNIEITNPDEKLEEGMVANCVVIVEKAENVVGLPAQAIQKDEENKNFVDVVKEDGTTQKTYVETGISDDDYVEITKGVNVGESVQIVKSTTTVVNKNDDKK